MNYHLTKTYVTAQQAVIKTYGDAVWEVMCDELPADGQFKTAEIIEKVAPHFPKMAKATVKSYLTAIVYNLAEMPNGGLVKLYRGCFRFHGPEDDAAAA
jgi:hypothetical protein